MTFEPAMNGLKTFNIMMHSSEAMELDKYNGWNFTTAHLWDSLTPDSYWYNSNTT